MGSSHKWSEAAGGGRCAVEAGKEEEEEEGRIWAADMCLVM